MRDFPFDILGVTETWFRPAASSDYGTRATVLRSDRKTNMPNIDEDEREGVGVALYIREGLKYSMSVSKLVIDQHSVDELLSLDIDSLCVILKVKRKRHYLHSV